MAATITVKGKRWTCSDCTYPHGDQQATSKGGARRLARLHVDLHHAGSATIAMAATK